MSLPAPVWRQLAEVVGAAQVLTSPEERIVYSYDATAMLARAPLATVFVESAAQIAGVLRLANTAGFKVVPRGSGTNLSGGTVPGDNAVVVVTAKMDRVL